MIDTHNKTRDGSLTSRWDGLSDHLIASFYEVERRTDQNGKTYWAMVDCGPAGVVKAPLTEASMETILAWQSPFEGAGADKGMPTIAAMLQSGALMPYVDPNGGAGQAISKFEGRTGITKLNSTQVFTGMQPVKIQVTALFRAWENPIEEVEDPFNQLMKWALPVELAPNGAVMSAFTAVKGFVTGTPLDQAAVDALLPSTAPVCIAMKYKGRTYSPLVIESIGHPMNSNVDANGHYVELLIPMTLCSLTAMDRQDWVNSRRSEI